MELKIGLFTQMGNEVTSGRYGNRLISSSSVCNNPMKMVAISVHEDALNSASLVYNTKGICKFVLCVNK